MCNWVGHNVPLPGVGPSTTNAAPLTDVGLRMWASQYPSPPEPGRPLKRNDDEQHQSADDEDSKDKRKYQNPDDGFRQ